MSATRGLDYLTVALLRYTIKCMGYQYTKVYEALRDRIEGGEFAVGDRLPSIAALQEQYSIASLGTVRAAQQMLAEDGLIRTEQGKGAFVVSTQSARRVDVAAVLAQVVDQLQTARAAFAAQQIRRVTIDLDDSDHGHASYVLTEALNEFAFRRQDEVDDDPDHPNAAFKAELARDARWMADLVEAAMERTTEAP